VNPTKIFEKQMFALENQLKDSTSETEGLEEDSTVLAELLRDGKCLSYHSLNEPMVNAMCFIQAVNYENYVGLLSATKLLVKPWDHMMCFPNDLSANQFRLAADYFEKTKCVEGLQLALLYSHKALRMKNLLYGRDDLKRRDEKTEKILTSVLGQIETTQTSGECAFCGERSECVAITLSKCSACRGVDYCSRGCQKAHWKVHKKKCGK
jgi:hypothetical protein